MYKNQSVKSIVWEFKLHLRKGQRNVININSSYITYIYEHGIGGNEPKYKCSHYR